MSQPAVSNHLYALEKKLGMKLLTRKRGLQLTPAGEALAYHTRRVLREFSSLEAEMARYSDPGRQLVVGASTTPGELLIPHVAAELAKRHPTVALEIHIVDTEETVAALLKREIEVAIVGREVRDSRFVSRVVEQDELVLVVSTDDPLAGQAVDPRSVADRPFVVREKGSATRSTAEEKLADVGLMPRVAMEIGSNAAVVRAVAEGAGIGVVPVRILRSHQHGVRGVRVRGISLMRPFVLLTERERTLSPAAKAFVATCLGAKDQYSGSEPSIVP